MININFFEALLVTHFVADWIFQTSWESENKNKKLFPLLVHSSVYALSFIPALYFYKMSFIWLIFLFITHIIIDQRNFELWFLKIKGVKKEKISESKFLMTLIGVDQVFHIIFLTIIVLLS